MNNQLPRPSPPPLPPVILSQTMDYGTCYHSNSNADRPVRLSTNCALEMVVIPTQKGFRVHDSIEVQFAFPHDTAVNGGQAFAHAPTHRTNAIHSPSNYYNPDFETSSSLEARRFARQQISDSACRRYSHVIGQLGALDSDIRSSQQSSSRHHSPPVRLTSASRSNLDQDLNSPTLERCQSTLESMEVAMTPEQKISSKRGEQEYVQKKTFTKWMNTYLSKANPPIQVDNLFEEIRDGVVLIRLLETLSHETLIEEQEDLLLELLGISKTENRSKVTAKQALTTWVQNAFSEQFNIDIKDFGPSWRDGVAFNAIVHSIDPKLVDMQEVERRSNRENLHQAFTVAEEKLGIPKILDPEDVDVEVPDEKSIMTYVAQFYKAFPETGKRKSLTRDEHEQRQFREFLDAIQEAESRITEAIQLNENFKNSYPIYTTASGLIQKYQEYIECLQDKVDNATLVGSKYSPQTGVDVFNHFQDRLMEWRWWLLERLPGELRQSGRWMVSAERWIGQINTEWRLEANGDIPLPAETQTITKLSTEQIEILGPHLEKVALECGRLRKFIDKSDLEESVVKFLEESNAMILDKLDGCVVTLETCNHYRIFLDALHESNITDLFDEWMEIVTGNRQNETLDLLISARDTFKTLDEKFGLSESSPQPVADLTVSLNTIMQLEQEARTLPHGMTSEVVNYWLQSTVEVFQPASLHDISIRELGQRLEERIQAWRTYETKLNRVVEEVEELYKDLQSNRLDVKEINLERIEELLQEAETAAGVLGTQTQLNSVAISRRQFDDLKVMIKGKLQEEESAKAEGEKKFQSVLASISNWNNRADCLLKDPKQIPKELNEKIQAIRKILEEVDPVD